MKLEDIRKLPAKKRFPKLFGYYFWRCLLIICLTCTAGSWAYKTLFVPKPILSMEMIDAPASARAADLQPFLEYSGNGKSGQPVSVRQRICFRPEVRSSGTDPFLLLFCSLQSKDMDLYFWDGCIDTSVVLCDSMMDLREILPLPILRQYQDQLVYTAPLLSGGYPFGIKLSDSSWLRDTVGYTTCIAGVSSNARNAALAGRFLSYLLTH